MTQPLVLLGLAALLVVLSLATARPPDEAVPDLDGYFTRWSTLHEGYDPRGNAFTHGWLTIAYTIARPLARRGVLPDLLTIWGVWLAFAVYVGAEAGGRWPILAGWLVVGSGLLDALDGCVAVLTRRTSQWGYVLDSLTDRICDVLYLAAIVALGGPLELAVLTGLALFLLEYLRARAGNAGAGDIGVVTPGERPTRVALCSPTIHFTGIFPAAAPVLPTLGLAAVGGLCAFSVVQLAIAVRRALLGQPAGPTSPATMRAESSTNGSPPPG
ncbi:MAG TPA: CDP-alcohol phosphatidyltransferase family protein [Mycobacteriales bacterium]|nr:CDP-alcohol phosphatidyltransferase family protein [Mycobacteriales bacterium]